MEKATLTISLPRMMKDFIEAKLREGRFSTPSEYIRALIRDDQDLTGKSEIARLTRRGTLADKSEASTTNLSKTNGRRRK